MCCQKVTFGLDHNRYNPSVYLSRLRVLLRRVRLSLIKKGQWRKKWIARTQYFGHSYIKDLLCLENYVWIYVFLTLISLGFLKVVFPGGRRGVNLTLPFIFEEELIQLQLNFIQLLNNLFKLCWKWKNVDIICYKLTSLVSL